MGRTEYHRVFLLSPANSSGERMQMLLRPGAQFDLARRLRAGGATLGEAFEFTSGLYFRGKLLYARTFARAPEGVPGVLVIAPGAGLVPADVAVDVAQIERLGRVPVDANDRRYREPLEESARLIHDALSKTAEIVLLGKIGRASCRERECVWGGHL